MILMKVLMLSTAAIGAEKPFDGTAFGHEYFARWQATQAPTASKKDINHYLSLLSDDIGHQHLPYDPDDSREPDGKAKMRKGMLYYLAAHTEHQAKLNEVLVGLGVVIIKYHTRTKGTHPNTGKVVEFSYDTVEVLEIENGKVSVVRKYSE